MAEQCSGQLNFVPGKTTGSPHTAAVIQHCILYVDDATHSIVHTALTAFAFLSEGNSLFGPAWAQAIVQLSDYLCNFTPALSSKLTNVLSR